MRHTSDLQNHIENQINDDNLPPITAEKREIGNITILEDFHLNEDILYQ